MPVQQAVSMVVNIQCVITLNKGEENNIISNYQRAKTLNTTFQLLLLFYCVLHCCLANHFFRCPVGGGIMS